jgi:hypothetical protein
MINLTKSQPAPDCLATEKLKKSGTYRCGDVHVRLKADFYNKCYICENKIYHPLILNILDHTKEILI